MNRIRTAVIIAIFGGLLLYNFTRENDGVDWYTEWDRDWEWEAHAAEQTDLPVDITVVEGIRVNTDIAENVQLMLDAAAAEGIELDGFGYRTNEKQIELRERHCGTAYSDVWEKPPELCSPPTALPGTSRHERGLAIDFRYAGQTIRTRSNPGFVWLAANAAAYGFENLPSEPWHWSVDGR